VGKVKRVKQHDEKEAATAIFSRHPTMQDWPADHEFTFYELDVEKAHLLDW
jgi:hypothetical protein